MFRKEILVRCLLFFFLVHKYPISLICSSGHHSGGTCHRYWLGCNVLNTIWGLCKDSDWQSQSNSVFEHSAHPRLFWPYEIKTALPGAATCKGVVGTLLPPPASSWAVRNRGDSYIPKPKHQIYRLALESFELWTSVCQKTHFTKRIRTILLAITTVEGCWRLKTGF